MVKKIYVLIIYSLFILNNKCSETKTLKKINILTNTELKCDFINKINSIVEQANHNKLNNNCILLHGEKENWKNYIIQDFLTTLSMEFQPFFVSGQLIKENQSNINKLFEILQDKITSNKNKLTVIIFIDINNLIESEKNEAFKKIFYDFIIQMQGKNVLTITTTDIHKNKVDDKLLKLFDRNIIEIPNPDLNLRKEIIIHQLQNEQTILDNDLINELAMETDKLSIEKIINLISYAARQAKKNNQSISLDKCKKRIRTLLFTQFDFRNITNTVPQELGQIIFKLKYLNPSDITSKVILLQGSTGNGKTALVNEIANYLNALLVSIKTQLIVDNYQGSGAQTIESTFQNIMKLAKSNSEKLVFVFFDEIDIMIRPDNQSKDKQEWSAAKQLFWQWIDNLKQYNNIFVVMATNIDTKKLDSRVTNRCGLNQITIAEPNESKRKEVIEFHLKRLNIDVKKNKLDIENLVKITNGLNIRSITNSIESASEDAKCFDKGIITNQMIETNIKKQLSMKSNKIEEKSEEEKYQNSLWRAVGHDVLAISHFGIQLCLLFINLRNNNLKINPNNSNLSTPAAQAA